MANNDKNLENGFNQLEKDIVGDNNKGSTSLNPNEKLDKEKRLEAIKAKQGIAKSNNGVLSLQRRVQSKKRNKMVTSDTSEMTDIKKIIEESASEHNFSTERARVSRYDDYRIIDEFIPEISSAMDVYTTSIIAPDDTSKQNLNITVNSSGAYLSDGEKDKIVSNVEDIVDRYEIDEMLYSTVRDSLLLGDAFYIVKDTSGDFDKILNEDDSDYEERILNESFIDRENIDDALTTISENYNRQHSTSYTTTDVKDSILKSINENVKFFPNSSELLSDAGKYKGSNDLQRFLDKAQSSDNINDKKRKKLKSPSVYMRYVNPEDMVKLEIDGMCIGYIYIEPESGSDIKGGANPLLGAMSGIMSDGYATGGQQSGTMNSASYSVDNLDPSTGGNLNGNNKRGMNATSGTYLENGNTAMAYQQVVNVIVKGISDKIDMDFVNRNDTFKDTIYRLIRKNYIIENGIKITFLEEDEVCHHKLDSSKTYGVSRIRKSLFFAKLYLSTLITSIMVKINQSRDMRVFNVNIGLDDDTEGTIQEVIRDIRSNETGTDMFNEGTSITTMMNTVSTLENMYIPVKDGEKPLEIDTISGMQVDINDEFLEWLKKSVISGTGVPLTYIDAEAETDYARSLSMQNNGFVRKIVNYQKSFGDFFTDVIQKIYYIENRKSDKEASKTKDYIEAFFAPPVFLNLNNVNEEISAVGQMLDFLVPLYYPESDEESEVEKSKREFKKEMVSKVFMSNLDFERYEEIIDEIANKNTSEENKERITKSIKDEDSEQSDEGEDDLGF